MIAIVTTNSVNLKDHIKLKNIKKLKAVGELDLISGNSILLKDEVLFFKSKGSKVELRVLLKWLKKNFNITSIIFFDFVKPINNNLLGNHIIIPKKLFSIEDPPLEWSNNPLINNIEIDSKISKKIRKVIYSTNYDFLYGDILSIDKKSFNATVINELRGLNSFDGLNYLIYTANKFAKENNIDIYNICIGSSKNMANLKFESLFKGLI
tara:strand:+ start:523 stop:1149 length:627 start_codon:yes stop_codon:yes gene_type:complete